MFNQRKKQMNQAHYIHLLQRHQALKGQEKTRPLSTLLTVFNFLKALNSFKINEEF